MSNKNEVDKFVDLLSNKDGGKWEGSEKKLYVPKDSEKSGATGATGFDVGQINEAGLKKLGFPKELNDKLKPYLGLKGDAARKALAKKPLTLTDVEVKTINRSVVSKTIEAAKGRMADVSAWDDMTETEKFATIAAQHQYGSGTQLPVQYGNRDWDAARNNLNTWSDKTKGLGNSISAKYKGLVAEIDKERHPEAQPTQQPQPAPQPAQQPEPEQPSFASYTSKAKAALYNGDKEQAMAILREAKALGLSPTPEDRESFDVFSRKPLES